MTSNRRGRRLPALTIAVAAAAAAALLLIGAAGSDPAPAPAAAAAETHHGAAAARPAVPAAEVALRQDMRALWEEHVFWTAWRSSTSPPGRPAWPRAEVRSMMQRHLGLTTTEAVAELTGNHAVSVRAFDRVEVQARQMADMLSAGIVAQFPGRFR